MFEVLSVFYPTHYNFAALSILLTITIIWLLTKKNYRWTLILLVILVAFNIAIYKRTEGKTWTISFDEETSESSEVQEGPKTYTFSAHKNWTITDEKGKTYHWCIDLVSAIWGDNKSKKMMKASEQRLNDNPQE